jgi:predicted RNA binding protein YcfA (HicA-like mRNA interferase family)
MIRLPMVASRTMISFLESPGFKKIRQHDSHTFFRYSDGRTVTVPDHKGEDLGRGITSKILHDAETSRKEFLAWFGKRK